MQKEEKWIESQNSKKIFIPREESTNVEKYKSERDIEEKFIKSLKGGGYEYSQIKNEEQLIQNLREKLELLNSKRIKNFRFTEQEWEDFFKNSIVGRGEEIEDKTEKIQGSGYKKSLKREDGTVENILLIDKENLENNHLQVINQYCDKQENYRYDVTILVNGLPLVHIELKKPGSNLKTAFNQIERYRNNSFFSSSGLFDFIQIFIISNGVETKYYANTTRNLHVEFLKGSYNTKNKRSSKSFEFTSWWADEKNNRIPDLIDFSNTFLKSENIIKVLTKYCVFDVARELKVLRPYQIFAIEEIIRKIKETPNEAERIKRGGYIWHTTGSGKTLTSFKAAQLIKEGMPEIEKVIFVVDRKDLNYKTELDYNHYEMGSANGTRNYKQLEEFLNPNKKTKIIITTIQKLNHYVKKQGQNSKFKAKAVLLIDECHRSQSGGMNEKIFKFFENSYIFGFTGTPIKNADGKTNKNTKDLFGDEIHTYTFIDALNDENVLRFRVNEVYPAQNMELKIDDPNRIRENVKYILKNYDKKTYRTEIRRDSKFNSIFATPSISMAQKYYLEFLKQLEKSGSNLIISVIYCYSSDLEENVNNDEIISPTGIFAGNEKLDQNSKNILKLSMEKHNETFKTNFKLEKNFDDYYKSVSQKLKENQIDMLIVVNMFLTGFDAPTLNTLWVDKNLKMHNLFQAFSRTNRIYNAKKEFGNIVSLRPIRENIDNAIYCLYGDWEKKTRKKIKERMIFDENFEEIYSQYKDICQELIEKFPPEGLNKNNLEKDKKIEFINLFGRLLRIKNRLIVCDDYDESKELINSKDFQKYETQYSNFLRRDEKNETFFDEDIWYGEKSEEYDPVLIRSFQIDVEYIVRVCREFSSKSERERKRIKEEILSKIESSDDLYYRGDIFINFFEKSKDIWDIYIEELKRKELEQLCKEEDLKIDETEELINKHRSNIDEIEIGREIDKIFGSPISRRNPQLRREKKENVIKKLKEYFKRFVGL